MEKVFYIINPGKFVMKEIGLKISLMGLENYLMKIMIKL